MQADKAYTVRPGTIESGKEYEFKMAALVALRCIAGGVDHMWIVSNASDVGAFDDVVLHVQTANQTTVYQLQLKHKENPDQIEQKEFLSRNTKEAFSLLKYSNDIAELKLAMDSQHKGGIIDDLGKFSQIYFGLFTNRTVSQYKFLDQDGGELWSLFNTKRDLGDVYKIDFAKVPLGIKPGDLDQFNKVYLLANQLGAKEIDEQVMEEMKKIFNSPRVDYKGIAKEFIKYVTDWAKGALGKPPAKHYYLGKQEVVHKLCELFFRHYEPAWTDLGLVAYDDPKKSLWNVLVQNQPLTIIDSSEAVLGFLPQYIWSEIKRYCRKTNVVKFIDCLTDKDKDGFFKAIDEGLERQVLKLVGGYAKITVSDIYKAMWMVGRLPLVLEVRKVEDHQDILHILQLAQGFFKLILVNGCGKSLDQPDEIATFRTLQDLPGHHRDKILKRTVQVQGRRSVVLAELVDDQSCALITAGDVVKILVNAFSIGERLSTMPRWSIRRNLGKILIKRAEAFEGNNQEVCFLIERKSNCAFVENLDVVGLEDVDFSRVVNVVQSLEQITRDQMEKLKKKAGKKVVHYCWVYDQDSLEWKWSTGPIDNLRPFVVKDHQVFDGQIKQRFSNPVNIISDSPGMGKSFLLDYVALQAPADRWLLRVNLNASEYHKYYRSRDCKNANTKAIKHLKYFFKPSSELDRLVFDKLLVRKDVVVLLDAFDEVSFSFKTEGTNIAKSLSREGYQIWLTTRPHMKRHLEQEFCTFGLVLKPFTTDDRKKFLTNYYTTINADLQLNPDDLDQFIANLLEAAQRNLHDGDAEFTGVPLQTRLLADFFNEDCRASRNNFGRNFDLLDLYDKFVEDKLDILSAKFGTGAEDTRRKVVKKYQSLCALKLVFSPQNLAGSFVGKDLADYFANKTNELELLQRDGIIVVENLNITCVHQTFAEFLSAEWLAETLQGGDEDALVLAKVLIKLRFAWDYYHFVFSIFDRILAKTCDEPSVSSLHLAVINRDVPEAKRIIEADLDVITELDGSSRSVLHVLALYTMQFPVYYSDDFMSHQGFNSDDLLGVLDMVPNDTLGKIGQDALGYHPLDYALANWSFTCAKVLYDKSSPITINSHVPIFTRQSDYLSYCIELGYQPLLDLLLPHFLSRNLLLNVVDQNTILKAYVDGNLYGTRTKHLDQDLQTKTVAELMRSDLATFYLINNPNADFFHAIILDSTENLDKLTTSINQKDANGCTLVHYACLHGKLPTLHKLLVVQDLEIDLPASGFYNNSPLHCALIGFNEHIVGLTEDQECRAAVYTTIVEDLLNNGASPNEQNNLSKTALHCVFDSRLPKFLYGRGQGRGHALVIKSQQLAIVRLLIANGVDVDLEDMSGRTALHMVVQLDDEELIAELLDNGADVNRQDWSGNTPLHCARAQGGMADFLISKGADPDIKNDLGETPFDDSDIIMLSVDSKK